MHGMATVYVSLSVCFLEAIEDFASPHQVVRLCAMLTSYNLHCVCMVIYIRMHTGVQTSLYATSPMHNSELGNTHIHMSRLCTRRQTTASIQPLPSVAARYIYGI